MSEESILILNMLREGKISAEQADSLLRAVRETGPAAAPPTPAPPPVGAVPDPAAMASMQARLAELQGKLGELQGKLGAAQTARAAGQAASLAGKVLDHLPRPDLDMGKISKSVDEAMRGLNSLKNDAVRTAKTAARQASQEARRATREGRKAMKFEFNLDFGAGTTEDRPGNAAGQPPGGRDEPDPCHLGRGGPARPGKQAREYQDCRRGRGRGRGAGDGDQDGLGRVRGRRSRTAPSRFFLTHQVENGRCKIGVAAPQDARERLTVDYEISVPRGLPLEVVTSFGAVSVQDASPALTARSASGNISVRRPWNGAGGDTRVTTASGGVEITEWSIPTGTLTAEATSGDLRAEKVSGDTVSLSTRSGDLRARDVQAIGALSLETASGDLVVENGAAGRRAEARTQSGHLNRFRAAGRAGGD